ncbi:hypothetical protein LCGC14_2768690, partial [marine sediment metagenome]
MSANRILSWYIENPKNIGSEGASYYLDRSYSLPATLRIYAGIAPDGGTLQVDIKDDGSSIFTNLPTVSKNTNGQDWWQDFNDSLSLMEQFSLITLEIPQSSGA